jgi:hypothetical protein
MMTISNRAVQVVLAGALLAAIQAAATPATARAQPPAELAKLRPPPPPPPPQPGQLLPPGATPMAPKADTTRANRRLLLIGGGTAAFGYSVALGTAAGYLILVYPFQLAFNEDAKLSKTASWLVVPVIGPLMSAQTEFSRENPDFQAIFYVDAAIQGIGFAMLLASAFVREDVPQPGRIAERSFFLGPGPEASVGMSVISSF